MSIRARLKNCSGRKTGNRDQEQRSILQNEIQLTEKRQGMTSVVPKMAKQDSGFSRCGFVNNEKQNRGG
jgi:hypothetical protein